LFTSGVYAQTETYRQTDGQTDRWTDTDTWPAGRSQRANKYEHETDITEQQKCPMQI